MTIFLITWFFLQYKKKKKYPKFICHFLNKINKAIELKYPDIFLNRGDICMAKM